jgi:hypothetical protein
MSRQWWVIAPAWVVLVGCGGASKSPASAPSGGYQQYGEPGAAPEAGAEESPKAGAGGARPPDSYQQQPKRDRFESVRPQSRYAEPPSSETHELDAAQDELMRVFEDFTVAESLALSGQAGCEHACQALRSMIRSAERVCALAQNDREQRVCTEARRRVRDARDFVRSSCGRCVDGPDLDED